MRTYSKPQIILKSTHINQNVHKTKRKPSADSQVCPEDRLWKLKLNRRTHDHTHFIWGPIISICNERINKWPTALHCIALLSQFYARFNQRIHSSRGNMLPELNKQKISKYTIQTIMLYLKRPKHCWLFHSI